MNHEFMQNNDVEMIGLESKGSIPAGSNISDEYSHHTLQPQQQQQQKQIQQPQMNVAQKSQKLQEFLKSLEDYKPTVPDALTKNYMHAAGFDSSDPRFVRLVSILGQKFIADITNDALQHYKMRNAQSQHKKQSGKDKKYVLAYEDLAPVLAEYGIDAKKPHYFF